MAEVGVNYPITEQMRACFKSKLWRMGQKISGAGSTKRKQIFEKWKAGKDSVWELRINATDVNNKLVKLHEESEQRLALQYQRELQLEKELEMAKKEITSKTSENQELHSLLRTAKQDLKELQESSKQLQECSNQQKRSKRQSMHDYVEESVCKAKRKRADFSMLSHQ